MKKYIRPVVVIRNVALQQMIATSPGVMDLGGKAPKNIDDSGIAAKDLLYFDMDDVLKDWEF